MAHGGKQAGRDGRGAVVESKEREQGVEKERRKGERKSLTRKKRSARRRRRKKKKRKRMKKKKGADPAAIYTRSGADRGKTPQFCCSILQTYI